jgi:hypothetical protein
VIEQRQSHQHIWQLHYREQRYARHLSQPELDRRIRDIILNLLTATIGGIGFRATEIAPDEIANESTVWLEKAAHMLEEMELRHGPFPAGFTRDTLHKEPLPDFASELAAKAAQRLAAIDIGPGEVLIKYGKRQYMESLYDSGALRIQPATYFADTNHNEAIQDDELNLALAYAVSREELMTLVTNPQILPSDAADQRLDLTLRWPSDYWVYCASRSIAPRSFVDYGADSCVIIRDRQRFERMLHDASLKKLSGTALQSNPVEYIDPILLTSPTKILPFLKHFRYTYQSEYRFCWFAPHAIPRAKHCDVQIGSLREFSDLIVL